jgi:hypothetical protein
MLSAQNDQALEFADRAITAAEASRDYATLADAVITKGTILPGTGRIQEGMLMLRGVIEFAEEHDLPFAVGRGINNAMINTVSDGDIEFGEYALRGLDAGIRSGDANTIQRMIAQRAAWLMNMHRLDEAVETLDSYDLEFGIEGIDTYMQFIRMAVEWIRSGDDPAFAEMRKGAEVWVSSEEPQTHESGKNVLAWLALVSGDYETARDLALDVEFQEPSLGPVETAASAAMLLGDGDGLQRAIDLAATYPAPGRKLDSMNMLLDAGRAVVEGRTDDAVAAFTELIDLLREHFFVSELQRTRALFAIVLPEAPEARGAAETAYAEITAAGAFHLLEVWKDAFPPTVVEAAG